MKNNLVRYDNDGLELIIDESTGEVFATQGAIAKMCNVDSSTIRRYMQQRGGGKTAEPMLSIPSRGGNQKSKLFDEQAIK